MLNETINTESIESRIFTIRGVQVMMDRDLAELYNVEPRVLNQARKRNEERFPESFCFQLTREELDYIEALSRSQIATLNNGDKSSKSQIVTLNDEENSSRSQFVILNDKSDSLRSQFVILNERGKRGSNVKYLPYVFTEQGVAMLSSVLRSETAVKVSVQVMNAFVQMRHFLVANGSVFSRLDSVERKQIETDKELQNLKEKTENHESKLLDLYGKISFQDNQIDKVFEALESSDLPEQGVFCDGQIFDAYSFTANLIRKAKLSIVVVDNYVDDSVLTMLDKRKANVSATIYTKSISKSFSLDLQKHNAQYAPINVRTISNVHDRFIFLDEKTVYHIGASLKDLGKKVFGFTRLTLPVKDIMRLIGVNSP